jgi:hypothetical protein
VLLLVPLLLEVLPELPAVPPELPDCWMLCTMIVAEAGLPKLTWPWRLFRAIENSLPAAAPVTDTRTVLALVSPSAQFSVPLAET